MALQTGTSRKRLRTLILGCLFFLICLSGCSKAPDTGRFITLQGLDDTNYSTVLQGALPTYQISNEGVEVLHGFHTRAGVEISDVQKRNLETSIPHFNWYPLHKATVVIAVDRDQCDVRIEGWRDLYQVEKQISYTRDEPMQSAILASMSYGLEGERYTIQSAKKLLRTLYTAGNLTTDDYDAPVVICYDYQAVALNMAGRNMEVIVPREGTFSFIKGIMTKAPLPFPEDMDERLLAAGLRLPNGEYNPALYSLSVDYEPAVYVKDTAHYAKFSLDCTKKIRRGVYQSRLYSAADGRESILMVGGYVIFIVLWVASVIHRAPQRAVRLLTFLFGLLLFLWILVRLIKWQAMGESIVNRQLWYAYYIFQLTLPLILLWVAWLIDKPESVVKPPRWLQGLFLINFIWIFLIFTNDLHQLFFVFPDGPLGPTQPYTYGKVFYLMVTFFILPFLGALILLIIKSGRNPRKRTMIFPVALAFVMVTYSMAYINGLPIALESDVVMVTGLISIFFFETALRAGLVPANTGYISWFSGTSLQMMIVDATGQPLLRSENLAGIDQSMLAQAVDLAPYPLLQGDHSHLFAKEIPGGYVVWWDSIRELNDLYRQIQQSVENLTITSAVLAEERAVREKVLRGETKVQLMTRLEKEISGEVDALEVLVNSRTAPLDKVLRTRVLIKMCYIKRRCNLFFIEQEDKTFLLEDLAVYFDELAELATHGDVQTQITRDVSGQFTTTFATLLYTVFYSILDHALQNHTRYLLVSLYPEEDFLYLKVLLPEGDTPEKNLANLRDEVGFLAGRWVFKDLEDGMLGLTVALPLDGVSYD